MTPDAPATPATAPTTALPRAVEHFLTVVGTRTAPDVADLFTDDAVVTDDGSTRRGRAEVEAWLNGPATQYEVVRTVLATESEGRRTSMVVRLDGDFPGGTVTLRHVFDLADDGRIAVLAIRAAT